LSTSSSGRRDSVGDARRDSTLDEPLPALPVAFASSPNVLLAAHVPNNNSSSSSSSSPVGVALRSVRSRLSGMFARSNIGAQLDAMAAEDAADAPDSAPHALASLPNEQPKEQPKEQTGASALDTRNPAVTLREPSLLVYWHDRPHAEAILSNRAAGAWMLRSSRVPGCLTMSVLSSRTRAQNRVVHILIGQLSDGRGFGEVDRNLAVLPPVLPSLRSLIRAIAPRVGAVLTPEQLGGYPPLYYEWENAERDDGYFATAPPLLKVSGGNAYIVDDATNAAALEAPCAPDRREHHCDVEMPPDVYERDFVGRSHVLLAAESESVQEIYAVHSVREGDRYRALRIHKRGTDSLFVLSRSIAPTKKAPTLALQLVAYFNAASSERAKTADSKSASGSASSSACAPNATPDEVERSKVAPGLQFRHIEAHVAFCKRVRAIEPQHPQTRLQTKLALIFSTADDPCGRSCARAYGAADATTQRLFDDLLRGLGDMINLASWRGYRGDFGKDMDQRAVFSKWRQLEVMFHVSTLLDEEQHRRLIGNDIGVVLWRPPGAPPLDLNVVDLGTVQQVYAVAQPVLQGRDWLYRVAFVRRGSVAAVGPRLPVRRLLTLDELRPLLLCFMCNAVCKALVTAAPMNMLFYKPRGATIGDVVAAVGASAATIASWGGELSAHAAHEIDAGALEPSEQENATLVVCVSQAVRLAEDAPAKPAMYCLVRCGAEEKRSPVRAGALPIFAHSVPLQLQGVRRATTDVVVELWLEKSRAKDTCVGQWRATLHTILSEFAKTGSDVRVLVQRRADDSNEPGDVGELLLKFELMGAKMHHDGEDDLTKFGYYFPRLTAAEATQLLTPMETGAFLVRPSNKTEGSFVISFKSPDDSVIHALITKNADGAWMTTGAPRAFQSIDSLISRYKSAGIYTSSPPKPK